MGRFYRIRQFTLSHRSPAHVIGAALLGSPVSTTQVIKLPSEQAQ
jgi:phosphate/sulfate permease